MDQISRIGDIGTNSDVAETGPGSEIEATNELDLGSINRQDMMTDLEVSSREEPD